MLATAISHEEIMAGGEALLDSDGEVGRALFSAGRGTTDLNAVLHAHPPALVAFSIARKLPDMYLIPSVSKACGKIAMAKYALPGSDELGENIANEFDDGTDIVLLENHGVCIGAKNLFQAFMKFETLEYRANLEILANKVGKPQSLTPEDIAITNTTIHETMDDFIPHSHTPEEQAANDQFLPCCSRAKSARLVLDL